ncbi:MAG TPA: LysR family transcriptional regulator [Candidatus Sulfotelmatobacter sp.]|nr:LysR family transcriptional regulator [Candidatus Sulfotelmatobacter sp.]
MEFTARQLRAFHLVAQLRNFTRAAEALFITPSGLSVLIRELERQLGFRIFDRTTRQVSLTTQGSQLLGVTLPALHALEEGMSQIEQTAKKKNRRISIGTTPWFAAHVLPPAIKDFRGRHPETQIQLFDGNLRAIVRRIEANKLDFAVGIFDRMPGLKRVPFFDFSLMLARQDDGRPVWPDTSHWSELAGETLISLTKDYPHEQLIRKQLARMGVACKRRQTVNLLDTQIGLVEAGLGIAVIPSFGVLASGGRKVIITKLDPIVTLEFYEISNRGRKLQPEAIEFSTFLKTYITRRVGRF